MSSGSFSSFITDSNSSMLYHSDAIEAFWAVLHIMKTLMQKLGYSLWLLANFDDAPTTLFELITEHTSFRVKINSLQDKMFYSPRKQPIILSDASSEDEITLSQMVYCGKDKGNTLECGDTQGSSQLFDWVILLIKTVLDLEEVADKVIKNIIDYLLSLLSKYSLLSLLNKYSNQCFSDISVRKTKQKKLVQKFFALNFQIVAVSRL